MKVENNITRPVVQKAGGLAFTAFLTPWAELFRDCKTTLFGVNEGTERARGLNCLAARNMVRRGGHGGDPAHAREAGHVVATRWLIKEAGPHHGKDSRQLAASLNLSESGKRGLLTNSRWGVLFFRAHTSPAAATGDCVIVGCVIIDGSRWACRIGAPGAEARYAGQASLAAAAVLWGAIGQWEGNGRCGRSNECCAEGKRRGCMISCRGHR